MSILHAHGHPNPARYTPQQVCLYVEAIWRNQRAQTRQRITEMRIAGYEPKSFEQAMQRLMAEPADSDD